MLPEVGTPLTPHQLITMLMRLSQADALVSVITEGDDNSGVGVIVTRNVPPGRELFALEVSAKALPHTHTLHSLYAGELVSMRGSEA